MQNNYVYKILNTQTGLYKKAGSHYAWGITGKIWPNKRSLSLHLSMYLNFEYVKKSTGRTGDNMFDYTRAFPTHKIIKYTLTPTEE